MSYRPSSASDDALFVGEPLRRADIDSARGVRTPNSWWWEAGPVSSCCYCFSVRTGVGILAMLDFLALGSWVEISFRRYAEAFYANLSDKYHFLCERDIKLYNPAQCATLAKLRVPVDTHLEGLYVEIAVSMIFGAIGLWSAFASNPRAAKLYLWTWVPRKLVGFAVVLVSGWTMPHTIFGKYVWLFRLFCLFLFLYYTKVIWSYQEVLRRRTYRASSSGSPRSNVGGGVELSTFV